MHLQVHMHLAHIIGFALYLCRLQQSLLCTSFCKLTSLKELADQYPICWYRCWRNVCSRREPKTRLYSWGGGTLLNEVHGVCILCYLAFSLLLLLLLPLHIDSIQERLELSILKDVKQHLHTFS